MVLPVAAAASGHTRIRTRPLGEQGRSHWKAEGNQQQDGEKSPHYSLEPYRSKLINPFQPNYAIYGYWLYLLGEQREVKIELV
jgi:hypothetical protein